MMLASKKSRVAGSPIRPRDDSNGSNVVIPFIRQPNNYSCGPTCIAMLSAAVRAPSHKLPPGVIGDFAGTNPTTGTTEVEMARGLTFAGLSWRRGSARSIDELQRELSFNNLVALRTLINGGKHWVVVSNCHSGRGTFSIMCPTMGPSTWTNEQLLQRWSARDFDHFVVPGVPIAHQPQSRRIHDMTLTDFTRGGSIIRTEDQGDTERYFINATAEFALKAKADPLHELRARFTGWTFYRSLTLGGGPTMRMLGIHESMPDRNGAAIVRGTTYVIPELRGIGGGVGLVLASYSDPPHRYLMPGYFSEAGYATRVRAHAIAITQAQEAGLEVSQQVIDSNPMFNPSAPGPNYLKPSRPASPFSGETLDLFNGIRG